MCEAGKTSYGDLEERLESEREARELAEARIEELLTAVNRKHSLAVKAEERLAAAEECLREIANECDCGFPRCQSNIARAFLAGR